MDSPPEILAEDLELLSDMAEAADQPVLACVAIFLSVLLDEDLLEQGIYARRLLDLIDLAMAEIRANDAMRN